MALEAAFSGLVIWLQKIGDDLHVLHLTLGDRPVNKESALVDHLENSVLDLTGLLQEAIDSACEAQKAIGHPMDLDLARRALSVCQGSFRRIEEQYSIDLVSYEKLKDLATLANKRLGEWVPWARTMKQAIEHCCYPLRDASNALVNCWQELAEHLGSMSISVQATNIGQQIGAQDLVNRGEGEKRWL